jgi:exodeoxyribonuclease VII large subunit
LLSFERRRGDVERLERSIAERMRTRLAARRARLGSGAGRLHALDPLAILARGYAVVYREGALGAPLTDAAAVRAGERLRIRLARGGIGAVVEEIHPHRKTVEEVHPHRKADDEVLPDREGETR